MKCATCPAAGGPCLGESVTRLCELARTRDDYRRQLARLAAPGGSGEPGRPLEMGDALSRVVHCPDRGAVLPASSQPECGCSERTECRAGRGAPAGAVTLQECLACVTWTPAS